jgi:hypothetical protein
MFVLFGLMNKMMKMQARMVMMVNSMELSSVEDDGQRGRSREGTRQR